MCTPRGFLLFPVLVVIGGLVLLGAEGLVRSTIELRAANRFLAKQQALALAEGRLDEVVTAIAADPVTASQWTACPAPAAAPLGTTTCTMGPLGTPFVDGPGGIIKREVRIEVSGLVPDALNPQGQQTVEAVVAVPVGTVFGQALWGTSMTLNEGTRVDSYDSFVDRNPSTFGSSATVQSGLTSGALINQFVSSVFGDLLVFPGGRIVCVIGPCFVSGVQGTASPPPLPPVRMPTGTPSGSPLTSCPGGALTFDVASFPYSTINPPPGTPCDITLNGDGTLFFQTTTRFLTQLRPFALPVGSRLTVNGHVQVVADRLAFNGPTVVLGANASFSAYARYQSTVGGDINNPGSGSLGRPRDFTVYAGLSGAPIGAVNPISYATGPYYGTFYERSRYLAPSGQMYGSFLTSGYPLLTNSWSQIHQDLSLKNEGAVVSPSNPIRRRSWRIVSP